MKKAVYNDLQISLDKWNEYILDIISNISVNQSTIANPFDEDYGIEMSPKHVKEAKMMIINKNLTVLKENPLLLYEGKIKNHEQSMPFTHFFKLFEEMMEKKYESDITNLISNRPTITMPDFFISHFNRVYGLRKIAQKTLSQMIISLREINEQNIPYGKIICKLLQINDPQPAPDTLALFITKAWHDFNKLIAKKQNKKLKNLDEIHLTEAINLLYCLVDTDKSSRANAIHLLRPKNMKEEEYLIFRICYKILKMGKTVEKVFIMFDNNSLGYISSFQLIDNIKKYLELSLSEQDINTLIKAFDPQNNDIITHDQFLNKISIKHYIDQSKDDNIHVTKSDFLSILIDVYQMIQIKDTAFLTTLFKAYNKIKISQADFIEIILKIDNKLSQDQIEFYYDFALVQNLDSSLDGVTLDALIKCVFQNTIGGLGIRDFSNI